MDHFLTGTLVRFYSCCACLTQTIFIDSNDFYTLQYTEQNATSDILSQANITQASAALFMFYKGQCARLHQ